MRKTTAAIAAFTLATTIGIGVAGAAPSGKLTICHGTASDANPYVEITVNQNSFKDGHFDGVPNPSHGPNNNPDFILWSGTCDNPGPIPN